MSKCSIKATKETFSEPEKGKTTRTKEKKKSILLTEKKKKKTFYSQVFSFPSRNKKVKNMPLHLQKPSSPCLQAMHVLNSLLSLCKLNFD